jgi:hypothetical protein
MKTRYLLLGFLTLCTAVFATHLKPPYDKSKPPKLPLPTAYQLAVAALGSATNQFHCVGASLTTDFYAPAWSFTFCNTNPPPTTKVRYFVVVFDGKVMEDGGFR